LDSSKLKFILILNLQKSGGAQIPLIFSSEFQEGSPAWDDEKCEKLTPTRRFDESFGYENENEIRENLCGIYEGGVALSSKNNEQ
jgi:hypothetical protein